MKIRPNECLRDTAGKSCAYLHREGKPQSFCEECGACVGPIEVQELSDPASGLSTVDPGKKECPKVVLCLNGYEKQVPDDGSPLIIGSSRDADFRVTGDAWVLPFHTSVSLSEGRLIFEDFDANFGHWIRGGISDSLVNGGSVLIGTSLIEVRVL